MNANRLSHEECRSVLRWWFLFSVAFIIVVYHGSRIIAARTEQRSATVETNQTKAIAAFNAAYSVFMHPRCVNCHPAGDSPLRGEDSQPHAGLRLRRGPDGQGVLTLKCTNCHQAQNQQGLHMPPGAPNISKDGSLDPINPRWHLPPAKTPMIFQGRTAAQLCRQLQDPQQNGGLTAEGLIHHVSNDPLVLWGWNPGEGRTAPPLTHDRFVASVREWLDNGGACPK
jgi:hypothetical protein